MMRPLQSVGLALALVGSMLLASCAFASVMDLGVLGSSARDISLGNPCTGEGLGIDSLFNNPAGMVRNSDIDAGYMGYRPGGEVNYEAMGVRWNRLGPYNLGVGLQLASIQDIYQTALLPYGDHDFYVIGTFKYEQSKLRLTLADQINPQMSIGMGIGLENILVGSIAHASGISFSTGIEYQFSPEYSVAARLDNLFGQYTWDGGKTEAMRKKIMGGCRYSPTSSIQLMLSLDSEEGLDTIIKTAVAWRIIPATELRASLYPVRADRSHQRLAFNLGAGIDLGMFALDYVYKHTDAEVDENNLHIISMKFSLGVDIIDNRWVAVTEAQIEQWRDNSPEIQVQQVSRFERGGASWVRISGEVRYAEALLIDKDKALFYPLSWLGRWTHFDREIQLLEGKTEVKIEAYNQNHEFVHDYPVH